MKSVTVLSITIAGGLANAQPPTETWFKGASIDHFGYVKSHLSPIPASKEEKKSLVSKLLSKATIKDNDYLSEYQTAASLAFTTGQIHIVRDRIAQRIHTLKPTYKSSDELYKIDRDLWLAYSYAHILCEKKKNGFPNYRPKNHNFTAQYHYKNIVWKTTFTDRNAVLMKSIVSYLYGDISMARSTLQRIFSEDKSALDVSLLMLRFLGTSVPGAPSDLPEVERRAINTAEKFPKSGRAAILAAQLTKYTKPELSKKLATRTLYSADALPHEKEAAKKLLKSIKSPALLPSQGATIRPTPY